MRTNRYEVETELEEVRRKLGQRREELSELNRSRFIEKSYKEGRTEDFTSAVSLKEFLESEIANLVKKRDKLVRVLTTAKAQELTGAAGLPSNRAEVAFLLGFVSRELRLEAITIDAHYNYRGFMDGTPVRGLIQRFGEPSEGITICWRKADEKSVGKFVELEKFFQSRDR